MATRGTQPTLLCFSHLRWNFVYQRPQHLMSRAAREFRVYFFEERIIRPNTNARLEVMADPCGVTVVTPVVPEPGLDAELVDQFIAVHAPSRRVLWYYTPMMRRATAHLGADLIVYDCMDELSAFRGAPAELTAREAELFANADVVFTGGLSLYMAKSAQHRNVHAFPISVDVAHFAGARDNRLADPADQCAIGRPRLGYFGVIDERLDIDLLDRLAAIKPDWCFVMIGPVVKIDRATLPRRDNIHWLGGRNYRDLPGYLANWDVGLMPFAMNEATRFISPTKTPEYLAAGLPVVSAPIRMSSPLTAARGSCGSRTQRKALPPPPSMSLALPATAGLPMSTPILPTCRGTGPGRACSAKCAAVP
jgi:UDP-galactopyranose mutase